VVEPGGVCRQSPPVRAIHGHNFDAMKAEKSIPDLEPLRLLEHGRNEEASACMREHLPSTLKNRAKIRNILKL
jgi:hypothetical protein